ncbi:MAG: hypothetical protein HC873_01895 [Leptolyngbyaceae cyanobacterium SL_1_1]|nr:hypothetical protein [Leptolyngbyaceae cyanobacterium SL_1_1]
MFLLATCFPVGSALASLLKINRFGDSGNLIFLAVWLGISFFCMAFTALSIVFPIFLPTALTFYLGTAGLSLFDLKTQRRLLKLSLLPSFLSDSLFSSKIWTIISAVAIFGIFAFVAIFLSQQIIWYDTGNYHLGSIRWLSDFGAVPGIALINSHLGKVSSWFAFSASLINTFLGDRIGAVTNGFILFIAVLHVFYLIFKLRRKALEIADGFLLIFLFLLVLNYILIQPLITAKGAFIVVSFSPDVPVSFITGIIIWLTIAITIDTTKSGSKAEARPPVIDERVALLFLSTAAVTIKITALPLLAVSILVYSLKDGLNLRRWIFSGLFSLTLLSPFIALSVISSGCPLYPSRFMCLDVPWLVEEADSIQELEMITQGVVEDSSFVQKWLYLFSSSPKLLIVLVLSCISFWLGAYFLVKAIRSGTTADIWVPAFGLSGISFLMLTSHDNILRFGIGYFLIVPCWFAVYLSKRAAYLIRSRQSDRKALPLTENQMFFFLNRHFLFWEKYVYGATVFFLGIALAICFHQPFLKKSGLLLPPLLPGATILFQEVNQISFFYPKSSPQDLLNLCWYSYLPCAASPRENVVLRNPEEGVAAGFVNK